MKTAEEYPVTFPYGATTHPYTPDHPHTGEDRKMPVGTPIPVNGHIVALSGNTGKSTGPHDHTQRVVNGKVQPPLGGGFALPEPVVVTETGERADIGKFIRLRDGNGEIWSHFHLSEIKVKAGQKIGEDMQGNPNGGDVDNVYLEFNGRKATEQEKKVYTSKPWNVTDGLYYGKVVPEVKKLDTTITELQKALNNAGKNTCTPEERQFLDLRKKI